MTDAWQWRHAPGCLNCFTRSVMYAIDLAVQEKVPAEVVVETAASNPQTTESFIAPVVDPQTGQPIGALLGRTTLRNNPILVPVVDILETGFVGSGEGFIDRKSTRLNS